MRMKKILLTVGMLLALISLTACGGNLDPFELLERVHEVEADMDSIMIEVEVDMIWDLSDVMIDIPMTVQIESESQDRWRTAIATTILGEHEETSVFVRDGYEYTEKLLNGTIVNRFRAEELSEHHESGLFFTHFISAYTVDESSATSTDDGYRLDFLLNLDGILAFLEEFNLAETISAQSDLEEEEFNGEMIIYMDDEYRPTLIEVNLEEIDLMLNGGDVALTFDMTLTTVQVGDITVEFPEWLDVEPVNEADLVGVWTWEVGSEYFLFFDRDQTGFLLDNTAGNMVFEDFTWEVLNENHLYIDFEANMGELDRQEVVLEGNVLTMLNLDTGIETTLYFSMTMVEFADFLESLVAVDEADLAGVWTWNPDGEARDYLLIFDYDQTGFLFDDTSGNMILEDFTWEIVGGNHLYIYFEANMGEVDRQEIMLDMDTLRMVSLDSGIETVLYFVMTVSDFVDFLESLEDEMPTEEAPADEEAELVGTWEWDLIDEFQLVFNADGTGEWVGVYDAFRWETSGDELTLIIGGLPEHWRFEIRGRNLIISSLDMPGLTYTYIRR